MLIYKGLLSSDIYLYKNIIKKSGKNTIVFNSNKKTVHVIRKNFYKRRRSVIGILYDKLKSRTKYHSVLEENHYANKIYDEAGFYVVSTGFFVFFKILRKTKFNSFLVKKLAYFINERLNFQKKKFIYLIDGVNLLSKSCQQNFIDMAFKNKQSFSWVFIGRKVKKNTERLFKKNYHKCLLLKKYPESGMGFYFNCKKKKTKRLLYVKKKYRNINPDKTVYFYRDSDLNNNFKHSVFESKPLIFLNFLLFNYFYLKKIIHSEIFNIFFKNLITINDKRVFSYHMVRGRFKGNSSSIQKIFSKQTYLNNIFFILASTIK